MISIQLVQCYFEEYKMLVTIQVLQHNVYSKLLWNFIVWNDKPFIDTNIIPTYFNLCFVHVLTKFRFNQQIRGFENILPQMNAILEFKMGRQPSY